MLQTARTGNKKKTQRKTTIELPFQSSELIGCQSTQRSLLKHQKTIITRFISVAESLPHSPACPSQTTRGFPMLKSLTAPLFSLKYSEFHGHRPCFSLMFNSVSDLRETSRGDAMQHTHHPLIFNFEARDTLCVSSRYSAPASPRATWLPTGLVFGCWLSGWREREIISLRLADSCDPSYSQEEGQSMWKKHSWSNL